MGLWVTSLDTELASFCSQDGLEGLFEALPVHTAVLDQSGVILCTNPAWNAFAQANGARIGPGMNYLAVCEHAAGPESAQARTFANGMRRVLRGELSKFSMDYACHGPGQKRWFIACVAPLNGRWPRILVTHWDVTGHALAQEARELAARRSAESALRHAQEQNRLLSHTMLQGLIYQDARGAITSVNPAAERILGFSQAELQALSAGDLARLFVREDGSTVPPQQHPAMVALRTGCFQNPITLGVLNPKEKGCRWISISAVPLFLEGEEAACQAYSIFEDVTTRRRAQEVLRMAHSELELRVHERTAQLQERNQALAAEVQHHLWTELALRSSESRFRLLAENSTDMICRFSPDGICLYISPSCRSLLGYEPEELLGTSAYDFFHPDEAGELAATHAALLAQPQIVTVTVRTRRKDGSYAWHETTCRSIFENGQVKEIQSTSRDITERKAFEEALQRAYRALRVLKACDEALVRANEESELLARICSIIVEIGGARMAWVGWAEHNEKKIVRPVVSIGSSKGYLKAARISWGENARGRGPTGTAIRKRKVTVSHELGALPRQSGWRKRQQKWGINASVALPLVLEEGCIGALTIYSADPDAFKGEEVELYKQLAADLAFGISSLRIRQEHERLQQEILQISEREKQRFAQELHDGLCQHLTGTAMLGSVLYRRLLQRNDPEAEPVKQICDLLKIGADEARGLAHGLHPVRPEPEGLMDALAALARTSTKLFPVVCTFQCEEPVCLANQTAANHLFRIAQEALNNAMKHGHARKVTLELKQPPGEILLRIRDNGIGIARDLADSKGMGMQIMKHRAAAVGAKLKVARAGKRGTVVSCTLPCG